VLTDMPNHRERLVIGPTPGGVRGVALVIHDLGHLEIRVAQVSLIELPDLAGPEQSLVHHGKGGHRADVDIADPGALRLLLDLTAGPVQERCEVLRGSPLAGWPAAVRATDEHLLDLRSGLTGQLPQDGLLAGDLPPPQDGQAEVITGTRHDALDRPPSLGVAAVEQLG